MPKDGSNGAPESDRKMILDESEARTWRPDIFQVRGTSDEIFLLFGSFLETGNRGEVVAADQGCIVMNPLMAKRFIGSLETHLAHQPEVQVPARYGGILPRGSGGSPDLSRILTAGAREETVKRAGLLLDLVHDFGTAGGFERSFKISEEALLPNRFLIGVNRKELGPEADSRILNICRETGMPKKLIGQFEKRLPEVNFVLFGFEENERSSTHKVYLEYYDLYPEAIKKGHGREDPFLLHRGYKWDSRDRRKTAVTDYTWHPKLAFDDMSTRIARDGESPSSTAMGRILEKAAGRVDPEKFIFLEVAEGDNPRSSLDINLYKAGLKLKEVAGALEKACRDFSVPLENLQRLYEGAGEGILGHMAGGIDRTGKEFLTIYYEPPEP